VRRFASADEERSKDVPWPFILRRNCAEQFKNEFFGATSQDELQVPLTSLYPTPAARGIGVCLSIPNIAMVQLFHVPSLPPLIATGYASHQYSVPVPSQDKMQGLRQKGHSA